MEKPFQLNPTNGRILQNPDLCFSSSLSSNLFDHFPLREMAALSLGNFTLSSHCYMNHCHKFSLPTTHILSSSSSLCYLPKLRQPVRKLLVSQKPTSKPLVSALFSPPQKSISKFFADSIAAVLLGSLIFMGSLKSRPVFAQPVQESESVEEKRGSRLGGSSDSEEEAMCVKLLQENPRDVEALKMVVNVKMKRGKTREAVEYVERLIELQPNEMEWRLLQALCCEMMGNLSKAKSLFKNTQAETSLAQSFACMVSELY
ncbi:hypothetical protein Sango_1882800 [Sesamum angolense]|uniref:Chloroplast lumen common family protein n=1 Tax=Sesamum angolense TaxID=2727404 RepID=A0AAE1WIL1_9LAMI|nr:hypothetical protein Sango_1882800 [Sesamum angolense]